ncbi:MAG TPA: mitofilin family membrane protein [Arenibaculum sp.]|nr:mitofilin family membrane protein [Arenibaculum sp.]
MSPRPDLPDDNGSEPADGTPASGAAERIIEKFGGIRPMAHKLEVPVTTVQGWKKRGAIPTVRHADLIAAAERHGIDIDAAELAAAAPGEERPGEYPAETGEHDMAAPGLVPDALPHETGAAAFPAGPEPVDEPAAAGWAAGSAAEPATGTVANAPPADEVPPDDGGPRHVHAGAGGTHDPRGGPGGGRGLATAAVVLSVLALGTALTSPWWGPELLGEPQRTAALDARIEELAGRLDEIDQSPRADAAQIDERLAGLEQAVADLDLRLAELPREGGTGDTQPLADRIAQLERQVSAGGVGGAGGAGGDQQPATGPSDVERMLQPLAERVAQLSQQPTLGPDDVEQQLQPLAQRIDQLSQQLSQLQTLEASLRQNTNAIATLETEANRLAGDVSAASQRAARAEEAVSQRQTADADTQALVLAAGQLRAALQGSGDFATELHAVRQIGTLDARTREALAQIGRFADTGIPTESQLADYLESRAGEIVRAGRTTEDGEWYERALDRVGSLVTVRRVTGAIEGDDATAIVARAQARMEEGDLDAAVEEIAGLEGSAAAAAAFWLSDARARLAADRAVTMLTRQAISRLAGFQSGDAQQDGTVQQ